MPSAPGYEVNTLGQIRNARTGRLLKPSPRQPYGHTYWMAPGQRLAAVHATVLETFVGPRPPGHHGRHLNGTASDNRLENLAWGTPLENAADKLRHGTQLRGEAHGASRLTEAQVREIRRLYATEPHRALARRFGVSHMTIWRVATGRSWEHIR